MIHPILMVKIIRDCLADKCLSNSLPGIPADLFLILAGAWHSGGHDPGGRSHIDKLIGNKGFSSIRIIFSRSFMSADVIGLEKASLLHQVNVPLQ